MPARHSAALASFVASPRADLTRKVRQQRLREAMGKFLTEAVHLGATADEVYLTLDEELQQALVVGRPITEI